MHLAIPLSHLGLLVPGLNLAGPADQITARLREHFAFLGPVTVSLAGDHVRIEVQPPQAAKTDEAGRLAERAAKRAREGDFARAAELYQRVLQLQPSLAAAHREFAMCLMELGRLDAAKDALIDALKLAPDDAWSFVILGNVYSRLEQPALAKRFQLRALELKPGDAWALNGLAAAEMALGETASGLAHFTEATRLHPSFPNAWLGKASAEHKAGRPADTDLTLRGLFAHALAADARDQPVFTQARRLFLEAQTVLAVQQESDAFKATQALRVEVETLSGHAIDIVEEKLPAGIAGRAQMAWKHGRARHRISLCPQDPPPPPRARSQPFLRHHPRHPGGRPRRPRA
ncbi:MAG: tetratricopeptide repeat protein [Verrucomicrobia bacterium]|nr:tetratricopeptide repeat protein [Verrucomicrobiota bacterium]